MSPLINAKGISRSHSAKVLFDNLDLSIQEGDRIGLIGANGVGKSTLLNILALKAEPDEGEVTSRKFLKMAVVGQENNFPPEDSVIAIVTAAAEADGQPHQEALVAAQSISYQMGFADLDAKAKTLSGGWQRRLSIASALVCDPEIVFLDEPTNHLDQEGWDWLKGLLLNASFAWMMTSHDRAFLQATASRIVEMNHLYPGYLLTTKGRYADHLAKKAEYLEQLTSEIASLSTKMKREDEWLSRGPKARTTKSKSRIDAAGDLREALAHAKARVKQSHSKVDFTGRGRQTKKLIEAKEISKAYGDHVLFSKLSLILGPGMRYGVLGPNGSGKSTLLKCLIGEVAPDQGSVKEAPDLKVAYFSQGRDSINETWPLKRALAEEGDAVIFRGKSVHVISWAKRFLFQPEQMDTPVSDLSGGEKARVIIARFMLQEADVLILDEPTNDLDIPTLEALEESLLSFEGAVIMVSHDRFLVDTVCNKFIGLLPGGGHEHYASYAQWQKDRSGKSKGKAKGRAKEQVKEQPAKPAKVVTHKLSYMDQRDYDSLEERIQKAEDLQAQIEARMSAPEVANSAAELAKLSKEHKEACSVTEKLYARWEELEAKIQGK